MKRLALKSAVFGLAASGLLVGANSGAVQAEEFITIGTGGQTGVYYVVGQSICRLVNRENKGKIKCTAPSTGGSVANLNAIRAGEQDMGVAQSDWQYHAYNGTAPDKFPDGANPELRAVFSVHPEPYTVVARADSGVAEFADLKGKRVNIGNPGSGARGTTEVVMKKLGWTVADFKAATELKSAEQSAALCDNKVDAILFTVGHPSGTIKEATTSCESVLVPVTGPAIDSLVDENDYYAKAMVPGGMYRGTDSETPTFGVGATFVSSTQTSPDIVYAVVKAVFDNFDRFKKLHPAFANLKEEDMIKNMLSAPLHEGAARYYKERGWM